MSKTYGSRRSATVCFPKHRKFAQFKFGPSWKGVSKSRKISTTDNMRLILTLGLLDGGSTGRGSWRCSNNSLHRKWTCLSDLLRNAETEELKTFEATSNNLLNVRL